MNNKGIVSIIALAIFTLLAVFGIIISGIVTRTYQNLLNTADNLSAQSLATSAIEMLEQQLKNHKPGYNSGIITCSFNMEQDNEENQNNHPYCQHFANLIQQTDQVQITMEIRGSNNQNEALNTQNCGDRLIPLQPCYLTPLPGQGDAGENCELYTPAYQGQGNHLAPPSLTGGLEAVDQIDLACNWNILALGSDLTDAVTIPLFRDGGPDQGLIHPLHERNNNFYLRLRTPCNCTPENQATCSPNACRPQDRYQLARTNQTIVDWQISGLCDNTECNLVSSPVLGVLSLTGGYLVEAAGLSNVVMRSDFHSGLNNSVHQAAIEAIKDIAQRILHPKLTLVLTAEIISANQNNIPYLEYQILSNFQSSSSVINIKASVSHNGNTSTLSKKNPIEGVIIDFAIQN